MGKTNPGKNENPEYSGVSTNTLTGDATAFETGSSELSFERYSFSTENDNIFSLGNLTYFNGKALYNTGVSSVPLSVELKFTAPNGSTEAFSSDFNFVSTSNMGTAEALLTWVLLRRKLILYLLSVTWAIATSM